MAIGSKAIINDNVFLLIDHTYRYIGTDNSSINLFSVSVTFFFVISGVESTNLDVFVAAVDSI